MDFETRAIHDGAGAGPGDGRGHDADLPDLDIRAGGGRRPQGLRLRAPGNPTRTALEECLASLESAAHGLAFSSGLGATTTLMHLVIPGERVVSVNDVYGGVYRMFSQVYAPKGYDFDVRLRRRGEHRPRRAPRREDAHGLGRDADEPAAEHRRHPRRRRGGPRGGAIVVVDNTFAKPVPPAAARARRRRRRPLDDEVPRRALGHRSAASPPRTTRRSPSGCASSRSRSARCPGRSTAGSCCAD